MLAALVALAVTAGPLDTAVLTAAELGPDCKDGAKEVGSLHAQVSFSTSMQPPKNKLHKDYDCGGKPVSVYLSEYKDAKETAMGLALTGPQLWGELHPTAEHTDELVYKDSIAVVISGDGVAAMAKKYLAKGFQAWRGKMAGEGGAAAGSGSADPAVRVAEAVDCKPGSKDPLRAWCAVTMVKGKGYVAPPGAKKQTLLGITVALGKGKDVRESMLKAASISAFGVNNGKVTVRDITPENEDEAKELGAVAAQVAAVLKNGAAAPIKVSKGLLGFLPSIAEGATTAIPKSAAGKPAEFTLKNPTRACVVTVGKLSVWVVIEDAADGSWVNLYPLAPVVAG